MLVCPLDDDGDFAFVRPKHRPLNFCYLIFFYLSVVLEKIMMKKKKHISISGRNQNKYEYFFAFTLNCKLSLKLVK